MVVALEGTELARHRRSFVPADVVLHPAHARALRLAREARARLKGGDEEVPSPDLERYDRLLGTDPAAPRVHPGSENGSQGPSGPRSREEVAG